MCVAGYDARLYPPVFREMLVQRIVHVQGAKWCAGFNFGEFYFWKFFYATENLC